MHKFVRLIAVSVAGGALVLACGQPPAMSSSPVTSSSQVTTTSPWDADPDSGRGEVCTSQVIAVREVITRPSPSFAAPRDGVGYGHGQMVECVRRVGCWFELKLSEPNVYDGPRRDWIPVADTHSQYRRPGYECHNQPRGH